MVSTAIVPDSVLHIQSPMKSIKEIHQSFKKLVNACTTTAENDNFYTQLESSG
eukprot:Pgem_evm1s12845